MTEHVLTFDHGIIPQEKGWDCGPAATQVVLNAVGLVVTETQLIAEIGTTTNGTDDVSWIENRCLDRRLPDANYTTVYLRGDPPTPAQIDTYWRNLRQSIDTGHGVVNNWVSPSTNPPRAIKGSQNPVGYGNHTVYHYVAAVGYEDNYDGRGGRAVCIADSGFRPFFYWVTLEQCVGLITPKGYCYANTGSPAAPIPEAPVDLPARDRHALDIITEGRRRNITPRGQKIALATGKVESNFTIYANPKVPASMTNPLREAVGYDGYSVGQLQQQVVWGQNGWWWGDAATCMDPTLSAGLFYDRLARLDYNGPHSPGSYAQAVQSSAFPDRYDAEYAYAEQLYNRLSAIHAPQDPLEELLMSIDPKTFRVPSLSLFADPNGEDPLFVDMVRALDAHGSHEDLTVGDAKRGNAKAQSDIWRAVIGQGKYTHPEAVARSRSILIEAAGESQSIVAFIASKAAAGDATAKSILTDIEAANPAVLQQFINSQKGTPA